jgi:D-glycero-D-manno-heptose 1,7-bisphosphate phosphatase
MKRRAIFFDRDNTLIQCDGYLGDCAKVVLVDGAADAIARARKLGFAAVVISNQSGVARGYFTEETVHAVNARMDELLVEQNPQAIIDRHEFCPYHPQATVETYRQDSPLRKPAPGMILEAAEKLALDLPNSWVIGDAPRDIEAGRAAGCRTILFTDSNLAASSAASEPAKAEPDYVVSSLREALDYIERQCDVVLRPPEADADRTAAPPAASASAAPPPALRSASDSQSALESSAKPHVTAIDPPIEQPEPAGGSARYSAGSSSRDSSPRSDPRNEKTEALLVEMLREMRRAKELPHTDFSVTKMLAGVAQILVLAVLLVAYLNRADPASLVPMMLLALTLQTMTIALLIMERQR